MLGVVYYNDSWQSSKGRVFQNLRSNVGVVKVDADTLGVTQVPHVPVVLPGMVVQSSQQEGRAVPVSAHGGVVQSVEKMASVVEEKSRVDVEGDVGLGNGHLHNGDCHVQGVVGASAIVNDVPAEGLGHSVLGGVVVEDIGVGGLAVVAAELNHVSAHVESVAVSVGLDNDVSTLTRAEGKELRLKGLDGNEIESDDLHHMAVDGESLDTLATVVDDAKQVLLALLETELGHLDLVAGIGVVLGQAGAVKLALAVNEGGVNVVRGEARSHEDLDQTVVVDVIPVSDHDGAKIDVILFSLWAVDDDSAGNTAAVLAAVVRVVPSGAILLGHERVGEGASRGDRALADTGRTVLPWPVLLMKAVHMQRRSLRLVLDVVPDGHLNGVTPVGLDHRAGEGAVDEKDITLITIGGDDLAGDGPVVLADDTRVGVVLVVVGVLVPLVPGLSVGSRVVGQERLKTRSV